MLTCWNTKHATNKHVFMCPIFVTPMYYIIYHTIIQFWFTDKNGCYDIDIDNTLVDIDAVYEHYNASGCSQLGCISQLVLYTIFACIIYVIVWLRYTVQSSMPNDYRLYTPFASYHTQQFNIPSKTNHVCIIDDVSYLRRQYHICTNAQGDRYEQRQV